MIDLKAMIVDDSKVMRLMVMKSLRQTNLAEFTFEEAEDGAQALEKFQGGADEYEIMFVDINMPNMNGIELVQNIRESKKNADVPIVMVTSEKTMGKIEEAMDQAGADGYICKPFTVDQMTSKLGKIIEQAGGRKKKGGGFFKKLVKG